VSRRVGGYGGVGRRARGERCGWVSREYVCDAVCSAEICSKSR
jgi:hypothetical protein